MIERPRFLPFLFALLLPACALPTTRHVPETTRLTADTVQLPLVRRDGHFWTPVRLNGQGPYPFLFDTGSGIFVVAESTAADLELSYWKVPGRIHGAGESRWAWIRKGAIERVDVGGMRLRNQGAGSVSPARAAAHFGEIGCWILALPPPEGGIVGLGLFHDCLLTFDGPRRRIILTRGTLPEADGVSIFPYELDGGVPMIEVVVAGRPLSAVIDTGFSGWLSIPPDFAAEIGLPEDGGIEVTATNIHGQLTNRIHRLEATLEIGGHRLDNPPAMVGDGTPLLGSLILEKFAITFDQKNRRVAFAKRSGRVAEWPSGQVAEKKSSKAGGPSRTGRRAAIGR
jgi:clan AA aspartic protease